MIFTAFQTKRIQIHLTTLFLTTTLSSLALAAETFDAPYAGWDCKGGRIRGNIGTGETGTGRCMNLPAKVSKLVPFPLLTDTPRSLCSSLFLFL